MSPIITRKDISIIIPFYNEEANVLPVITELRTVLPFVEIVAIDDGSTDNTLSALKNIRDIRVVPCPTNMGKGIAIYEGIKNAQHEHCILMDGDGQFFPSDIPAFMDALNDFDLVSGYRRDRSADAWHTIVFSRIGNSLRRMILHDNCRDSGSGLKGIKRSHALALLPSFEGTHRFIETFFYHAGLRILEIPIAHRPRMFGTSKVKHFKRAVRGLVDTFKVRKITYKKTTL